MTVWCSIASFAQHADFLTRQRLPRRTISTAVLHQAHPVHSQLDMRRVIEFKANIGTTRIHRRSAHVTVISPITTAMEGLSLWVTLYCKRVCLCFIEILNYGFIEILNYGMPRQRIRATLYFKHVLYFTQLSSYPSFIRHHQTHIFVDRSKENCMRAIHFLCTILNMCPIQDKRDMVGI